MSQLISMPDPTPPTLKVNPLEQLCAAGLWKRGQPLHLHLGCGEQHFDNYINIDYPPSQHQVMKPKADAFANITEIEFPPQSVDEIRLHHVFEHFNRVTALAMLIRWHQWLKVGGVLHLETPDLMGSAQTLVSNSPFKIKMSVARHLAGDQADAWAYHVDHWFAERYQHTLKRLGFCNIQTRSWTRADHQISDVEVRAAKAGDVPLKTQLEAAEELLWNSTVSPAETSTHAVWVRQLHAFFQPVLHASTDSKLRILVLALDFRTWNDARYWSYPAPINIGMEEGLSANHVEYTTFPVRSIHEKPSLPSQSWLHHFTRLCADKSFDQVWFEVVHSHLDDMFLKLLPSLAPIRVGHAPESLEPDPQEFVNNPDPTRQRQANVAKLLSCATHVTVADEKDVDTLKARGFKNVMWWPATLPQGWVTQEIPPISSKPALFYGALYGERAAWLQDPDLKDYLVRPTHSPEFNSSYPQLFDALNRRADELLASGVEVTSAHLDRYLADLRHVRKECFSLWMKGLQEGIAVVNLPQFGKMYGGRVVEGMAAGRPVAAFEIPDRPRTRRLFKDGEQILLFSTRGQLLEHFKRIQSDPMFVRRVALKARNNLLRHHTQENRIRQCLEWIQTGTEPVFTDEEMLERSDPVPVEADSAGPPLLSPDILSSLPKSRLPLHEIHDFNQRARDEWVLQKSKTIPSGSLVLDVGAGTCPYRSLFSHCQYKTHDFKKFEGVKLDGTTNYGEIDYVSDIAAIPAPDQSFDCILCTEVLEHVPRPIDALREMSRLLKTGGHLFCTAPLGSGLHQLPFHYYGGYTPHFYQTFLAQFGMEIMEITPNGGFFKQLGQECARAASLLSEHPEFAGLDPQTLLKILADDLPRYFYEIDTKLVNVHFTVGFMLTARKRSPS